MQFVPTRLPIVVLQRVEKQFPEWREVMLSVVCLCADTKIMSSYSEDMYREKNKMFSRKHMLLSYSAVSDFKDDLIYL
jgi:hypothetical protein